MLQEIFQSITEINKFYQFLSIFVIALVPFLEAYVAVPIGILLGLPIIPTVIIGVAGNWLSIMTVITLSSFLRSKFFSDVNKSDSDTFIQRRIQKAKGYFNKYGVPGISLIGPITVGNHIGAFVSIAAGASKRKVMLWQIISIVIWAIGTGILVILGVEVI